MTRRYLSLSEVESTLTSGKSAECFLGKCERDGVAGVRWLSLTLSRDKNRIQLRRHDTADLGTTEYTDLYEFGPLNPDLEFGDADELQEFGEFSRLWISMEQRFPGSTGLLVNAGVVQEEYCAYKANGES